MSSLGHWALDKRTGGHTDLLWTTINVKTANVGRYPWLQGRTKENCKIPDFRDGICVKNSFIHSSGGTVIQKICSIHPTGQTLELIHIEEIFGRVNNKYFGSLSFSHISNLKKY